MRTILLAACMMWGWYLFHDQITVHAQTDFTRTMAWFGVNTRPYVAAAQTNGSNGVLDAFASQIQADGQRYMGVPANSGG